MTIYNGYATLQNFKDYRTAPGQTFSTDATDDAIMETLIESASRYIDDATNRTYYPRGGTRYYSVPDDGELPLDDDLLEVITLTNGDGTAVTSAQYNLLPRNFYPKYAVKLLSSGSVFWQVDTSESEYVIDLAALWGYHEYYATRAWLTGSTLNEAGFTAADTTMTVTSGTPFAIGDLARIENELIYVSSKNVNDLTIVRGMNGSTAATHANGTAITIWETMTEIQTACLEIAGNAYSRRYGGNQSGATVTTPAGLVIGPGDITETVRRILDRYRRKS